MREERKEERQKGRKEEERADGNRSPSTIARAKTFCYSRAWKPLTPINKDSSARSEGCRSSEEWTGTTRFQIPRTRLLEGYKWVTGRRTKPNRLPDQTIYGLKLGHDAQRNKKKHIAEWAEKNAKLQAARRNRGILEVLTDDKDYLKVIADVRLKLEKDTDLTMSCIETEDSRWKPQASATSIAASEEQSDSENTGACRKVRRQHMDHIAEKKYVGSFQNGLVHTSGSIQEAMKIPEAKAAVDKEWK